ncbi:hypothetical protein GCM10023321_75220 [Pseudonocardia eucalypti]|uniref:Uncharacterized protein n=1 Tax=Pseudonocardia eucalypti TaxID=648755 RepID=A0ABP9R9E1_9PSEU
MLPSLTNILFAGEGNSAGWPQLVTVTVGPGGVGVAGNSAADPQPATDPANARPSAASARDMGR